MYKVSLTLFSIFISFNIAETVPSKDLGFYKTYLNCISHIKEYESFSATIYIDNDGSKTIGYGHHITKSDNIPNIICKRQADSILISDFNKRINIVEVEKLNIPYNKKLSLSLFIYNVGRYNYKTSTLRKLIRDGKPIDSEIVKWCHYTKNGIVKKSHSLLNRRKFELKMWKNEIH